MSRQIDFIEVTDEIEVGFDDEGYYIHAEEAGSYGFATIVLTGSEMEKLRDAIGRLLEDA